MKKTTIMQCLKNSLILFVLVLIISCSYAQVAINTDGGNPDVSAMLDVRSTSKGFLPPRMSTSQMNDISTPHAGLLVYNTTVNSVFCYNGSSWKMLFSNDGESCGTINYGSRTYATVIIGTQCWMSENLNIGIQISGTSNQTDNGTIQKYCYNDSFSYCNVYGGLYQWDEMMQYVTDEGVQGICPPGWHIPTDDEWGTLVNFLSGGSVAGGKMKETGTAHWNSPNTAATNSSGFTALPGGYCNNSTGSFGYLGKYGIFASSTESSGSVAYYRQLYWETGSVLQFQYTKTSGFSVRCIKD